MYGQVIDGEKVACEYDAVRVRGVEPVDEEIAPRQRAVLIPTCRNGYTGWHVRLDQQRRVRALIPDVCANQRLVNIAVTMRPHDRALAVERVLKRRAILGSRALHV